MYSLSPSKIAFMATALHASRAAAFSTSPLSFRMDTVSANSRPILRQPWHLDAAAGDAVANEILSSSSATLSFNDDIDRLRLKASEMRAEVATLEAEKLKEVTEMFKKGFDKFDVNKDGVIDYEELKAGLENILKIDHLPQSRVDKLMNEFDASGDGLLQFEEFRGIDQFRNKLGMFEREERQAVRETAKKTQEEEESAKVLESALELVNDGDATSKDKIVSILPYLLPLVDGLVFGKFLFMENAENPIVIGLGLLLALYRTIPFAGFLSFFGMNVLSDNLTINRLVRFNMKQAILVDVALFVPTVISAMLTFAVSQNLLGVAQVIPVQAGEIGSDAVFLILLASIGYSALSSLVGVVPDNLPIISDYVDKRMISADMFDVENGQLTLQRRPSNGEEEEETKKSDTDRQ